ncbi:MAG: hypothetical protein A2252_04720 [Elusimicrobia bacterium RIFOXYA2_FULL_39_19]|nr:MAG: hypothetical protein A2252_04720 [Elusimicrobia bacterium RIFOXYA2_FULL_39_19]
MKKKPSFISSDLIIGLIISLVVIIGFLVQLSFFESLEYKFYDFRAKLRKSKGPSNKIVVVTIDDQSIANIGRWPWPRAYIAELIDKISSANPKVIGLNILFTEQDRNAGLDEIRRLKADFASLLFKTQSKLKSTKDRELLSSFLQNINIAEASIDNDTILYESIADSKIVVLPMFFTLGKPLSEDQAGEETPVLSTNTITSVVKESGKTPIPVLEGFMPVTPLDLFSEVSAGIGHSNLVSDSDGVIRRMSPVIKCNNKYYPSFALQLVSLYLGLNLDKVNLNPGKELSFGNAKIPLSSNNSMLIDFSGPTQTYQYNSVYDVLAEKIPPEVFKDKIILVGYMATGLTDLNVVPVGQNFPSTEIIANSIQNILEQKFIMQPSWSFTVELVTLIICALFITILLPKMKAKWGAIFTAILLIVVLVPSVYLFIYNGLWIKIFYPMFLLLFGYIVITSKRFLLTEKRKELVEAESIETNKMLGLSFQGQGMLDLAFEKFRKCPVDDAVKDLLYNLGLDFERKRQFNKAVSVYEHIKTADQKFKDIEERIKTLKAASEGMVVNAPGGKRSKGGDTVIMEGLANQVPTLGRYEIIKELGHGAMGTVYLGKDPKINRMVAIKTVRFDDDIPENEMKAVKERFFREAESAGNLSHPNIIRIFDAGEDYDVSYIAMELLEGEDLKNYCEKVNLFPIKEVVNILTRVADGLDYAHKLGVVHRDIKPANIMLLKDGSVRITDFGIARVMASSKTQTGTVLGTPSYMSPEQVAGKKVDGRADLFSFGVMLFEMLSGEKPFNGDSIATLIYQIANEKHPDIKSIRPEIPDCLVTVIDKALQKDPNNRYQNGKEIVDDLTACMSQIQ